MKLSISLLLLLITVSIGCANDPNNSEMSLSSSNSDSIAAIDNALNSKFGKISTKDESTGFADSAIQSTEAEVVTIDDLIAHDPIVQQAEVEAIAAEGSEAPGCQRVLIKINWGELDGNPSVTKSTNWTGSVKISDPAALKLLSTLHFENADTQSPPDQISPRPNRQEIDFVSYTSVHQDGLLIAALFGCQALGDSGVTPTLSLNTPEFSIDLPLDAAHLDYNETFTVDGLNNQVAIKIGSVRSCGGGVIEGGWKSLDADHGFFRGVSIDRDGRVEGYMKGFYGRKNEKHLIFAKLIDKDGGFVTRAHGTYDPESESSGKFRLAAHDFQDARVALMRGRYFKPFESSVSGLFSGYWKKFCKSSDDDMHEDELNETIFGNE